jgi:hypothetical protein
MALVIFDAGSARHFLAEGVEEFPIDAEIHLEFGEKSLSEEQEWLHAVNVRPYALCNFTESA